MRLRQDTIQSLIKKALKEDIGRGDLTTEAVIPHREVKASIVSRKEGIIAGLDIAKATFHQVAETIEFKELVKDGDRVYKNQIIAYLEGEARGILTAERTALNFLNRLSGIATLTSQYVEKVKPYGCKILDTRKTTPLLRELEKYAVRMGGGYNHRKGLYDMVLIKDNHLKIQNPEFKMEDLVKLVRERVSKRIKIEIEVTTLEEVREAIESKVDIIMLDNMSLEEMREAVKLVRSQKTKATSPILEASGGINLLNVEEVAKVGVDWISVGEITHSAGALDMGLEIITKNL